MRRTNRLLLIFFLCVLATLAYFHAIQIGPVEFDTLSAQPPIPESAAGFDDFAQPTFQNATPTVDPALCQYSECLKGEWVPREPTFTSLADFQAIYATRGESIWDRCPVASAPEGEERTEEETRRLEEQRLVDIMNWVWKPHRGEQIPWDPMDFVVRLLKTPGGIVFIGDSISQGHEHAFGSYLQEGGIPFVMNPPHLPTDPGIRSHILLPDHPITLDLQRRAGVPSSRLNYPIFTVVDEHMMIHQDEIRKLVGFYGAPEGWNWALEGMKRANYMEFFDWVLKGRPGEEESVNRDTIVVLNTGAHWSRGTLYMMPELPHDEDRARMTKIYTTLVKTIVQKLRPLSRITILYRATNPAHPSCAFYNKPVSSLEAYALFSERTSFLRLVDAEAKDDIERSVRRRWDWDLFQVHNMVWQREVRREMRARAVLEERGHGAHLGPKWIFVDFYEMSLQRPDAHAAPGRDCLHFCLPAIYNEWSRHIYHLLYLEMDQTFVASGDRT